VVFYFPYCKSRFFCPKKAMRRLATTSKKVAAMQFDSLNDALLACVNASGGAKVVGPVFWPELLVDAAARKLCDWLNPDQPHKLSQEQVLLIFRKAKEAGYHDGMVYFCAHSGYSTPVPVEPRDELADLQRKILAMSEQLNKAMDCLAAIQRGA
jgi:hypothetical protein